MAKTKIPEKIKNVLWAKSAGRCQYKNCNDLLYLDLMTKKRLNTSYIAHIVADGPGGPRGDAERSPLLAKELSNLMLLCDTHHRLIDKEEVDEHPEDRLLEMKRLHEERIERVTGIGADQSSHILLYGANIGTHAAIVNYTDAQSALLENHRYPAESSSINISLINALDADHEDFYWQTERRNLQRHMESTIIPRIRRGEIKHLSFFGVAPQPLLIETGRLLSDIPDVDVYQLHREPKGWSWAESDSSLQFQLREPERITDVVALVFSISATVSSDRVKRVLGEDCSIWRMEVESPHNDCMRSPESLRAFRQTTRSVLNQIKAVHGEAPKIHVFPVMPVSSAVELGSVWMPKADLPLVIYDQKRKFDGFVLAFEIV